MSTLQNSPASLCEAIGSYGPACDAFVTNRESRVLLQDLLSHSVLGGRGNQLEGSSVIIATTDQLIAAAALIELDGNARRIILCPPDLPAEHLPGIVESAQADAIVSDRVIENQERNLASIIYCNGRFVSKGYRSRQAYATEWVLLTSGTTGTPKLVVHTLRSLSGAIGSKPSDGRATWSTFYDIRRYGGLQIFLRAMLTGSSLLLSNSKWPIAEFLSYAGTQRVTHISGTPSHWRRALMSPSARLISPAYIRLSGEIADQKILNHLRQVYPKARIAHAFATTEAGVAFVVDDGMAGFPANTLAHTAGVEMKVDNGCLCIRSARTASSYLGAEHGTLRDADGYINTTDMLELRDARYYFVGRRDGVINVGGLKVHPEEVEAVINRHPDVRMSLVKAKKNPITGAVMVADVVLQSTDTADSNSDRQIREDILSLCREELASHKVPATICFVSALEVAESGKLIRSHA